MTLGRRKTFQPKETPGQITACEIKASSITIANGTKEFTKKSISELIGAKISVLRLEKQMTLETLAEGTGLTPSFLSKLERGQTSVSVDNVYTIASFLGLDIVRLLGEGDDRSLAVITRAGKGTPFRIANSTSRIESLVPISRSILQVHLHTTEPMTGKKIAFSHPGEEIVYVLSGEIRYWVNNESFILRTGDTIWHPSTQPHRYENIGKYPSKTLCVSTPPVWFNLNPVKKRVGESRPRGRTRAKLVEAKSQIDSSKNGKVIGRGAIG